MTLALSTWDHDPTTAWDCDPFMIMPNESYDLDLDDELDRTDWQVLALDRFGDRTVNGELR